MSEAVEAGSEVAADVTPLGQVESVAEFRARRDEGDGVGPVAEVVAEPVKAEVVEAEPDAASEAGKALAAKRGSLQARIDELTRKNGETERGYQQRLEALESELATFKARYVEPAVRAAFVAPDPNDPEPDVNAFDDYQKYVKAQARWEARQEYREQSAKTEQATRNDSRAAAQARVHVAAKAAHEDFDEACDAFFQAGNKFSPAAAEVILGHPLGHELAYALAKDPAANARLNAAPNAMVAGVEIGRILAGLEGKPKATEAPVTKAAPPVKPVGGAASAASTSDPASMSSVSEWRKVRDRFTKG